MAAVLKPRVTLAAFLVALALGALGVVGLTVSQTAAHVLTRLVDRLLARVAEAPIEPAPVKAHDLPPYPNPYWNQSYFIDPSNTVSGACASDTNNCTQNTCGAAGSNEGPCLTYKRGLVHNKWGTNAPEISTNVTLTFMSAQPAYDDPFVFHPVIIPITPTDAATTIAPVILVVGIPTTSTTTYTSLTTKNTAANQPFTGTFSPTVSYKNLLQNPARANGIAWATTLASNIVTTPYATPTINNTGGASNGQPSNSTAHTSNWATSDTVTVNVLPQVNIVDVEPTQAGIQGYGVVIVKHFYIPTNTPQGVRSGDDPLVYNAYVQLIEDAIDKNLQPVGQVGNYNFGVGTTKAANVFNSAITGGLAGGAYGGANPSPGSGNVPHVVYGGYLTSEEVNAGTGGLTLQNVAIDGDTVVASGGACVFSGFNNVTTVEVESSCQVLGTLQVQTRIWGQLCNLDAAGGRVLYPVGSGNAVFALKCNGDAGSLLINGADAGCVGVPTAASLGACGVQVTNSNLDTNLGATAGCVYAPGGGAFCNSGL